MTDRLKGVLVTFAKDIRDDDAESMLTAIKMIKGVLSVKEYITDAEDYMMYHRGYYDAREKMMKLLVKETENPTQDKNEKI